MVITRVGIRTMRSRQRLPVKTIPYKTQVGQAFIEAVIAITAMMVLLFAIQLTGKMRADSIDLLGESSYRTFMHTLRESKDRADRIRLRVGASGLDKKFSEQLLHVYENDLIRVRSERENPRMHPTLFQRTLSPLSLSRTSYLFVNAGQSDSANEVQQRIEKSSDAWLRDTLETRKRLNTVVEPLRRIDAPWGRASLTSEWLKVWAGQTPIPQSK